jgi:hypothetical protein
LAPKGQPVTQRQQPLRQAWGRIILSSLRQSRAMARAVSMMRAAIGPTRLSGNGAIGSSARSSSSAGPRSMPWAANMADGGGAAVAKLMAELPPSVMARTSSEASRWMKAPLPGTAAIAAICPRVPCSGAALPCSSIATFAPPFASSRATLAPPGPVPTTITSNEERGREDMRSGWGGGVDGQACYHRGPRCAMQRRRHMFLEV